MPGLVSCLQLVLLPAIVRHVHGRWWISAPLSTLWPVCLQVTTLKIQLQASQTEVQQQAQQLGQLQQQQHPADMMELSHVQAELAASQGRAQALESEVSMLRKQVHHYREQATGTERMQDELVELKKATSVVRRCCAWVQAVACSLVRRPAAFVPSCVPPCAAER